MSRPSAASIPADSAAAEPQLVSPELLTLLRCPETHQPLIIAPPRVVAALNSAAAAGTLHNIGGELVTEPIQAGLLRADGMLFYPIREGLPVMLVEEGISVG